MEGFALTKLLRCLFPSQLSSSCVFGFPYSTRNILPKTVSETKGCEGCPMRKLFPDNTFVAPQFPTGKDLVRIAIAEAAGEDEAKVGKPLVGGAGRWFDSFLRHAGIERSGLTIANCIQCRPPKNIFPTDSDARTYISKEEGKAAVEHCLDAHVYPLLASRDWRRVDLFGEKALRYIAGKTSGISHYRGAPLRFNIKGRELAGIATLHPALIARDQTMFPVVINDLKKSLEIAPENYNPTPSLETVRAFRPKKVALDIETKGFTKEILCVGFCAERYKAICVPFRGQYISEIKEILLNAEVLITHNGIQFDLPILFGALDIEW